MKCKLLIKAVMLVLLGGHLSCSANLKDKVRAYEQAHNNHDIEKVMAMYAPDISFELVGAWSKKGKEAVRGLAEWDEVTNSHMAISDIQIFEDTVAFKLKEGNDWFRMIGIGDVYYEPCRMVFEDGLIKELKVGTTEKSRQAFAQVWPPFYQWLSEEKSEDLSGLLTTEGAFIYNRENANRWLELLKEWNQMKAQEKK